MVLTIITLVNRMGAGDIKAITELSLFQIDLNINIDLFALIQAFWLYFNSTCL